MERHISVGGKCRGCGKEMQYVPTSEEKATAFRIIRSFQDEGSKRVLNRLRREFVHLTKENVGVLVQSVRAMLSECN
jgi:hypothetical protein